MAVRSSATAEDLPQASFAGQQETYLNVRGSDQLLAAVQKCWASLWTARAIGYRRRQGISPESVALGIVVQLLVEAESAGILFTINPLNGRRDELVINAAWGLGEAVVGGLVTPDTLALSKPDGRLLRRETAQKLVMTARGGDGTVEQPVPLPLQNLPVLSDEQASELALIGMQIEALYEAPVDVEWALRDGKFTVLQARPVTALPEPPIEWKLPHPKGIYMRTSVADLMPLPLSPLYATLGIPALTEQMFSLGSDLTRMRPMIAADYLTAINQYAYMNAHFPPGSWRWILFGLLPAYPRLLRVTLWRDRFHPEYQAFVSSKGEIAAESLSPRALWAAVQEFVGASAHYIIGLMFATMGASAGSEGLLTRFYDRLIKRTGDPDATVLVMGWDNIPIRAEKSLYDLAAWVKTEPGLAKTIQETPSEILAVRLTSQPDPEAEGEAGPEGWEEFARRFKTHQDQFGHIVFQLDFAEPLPREHPEMLLETIKMYLRGQGADPYERQKSNENRRIQAGEGALKRTKGLKRWIFKKMLHWGQSLAEVREDALAEIGLAYPQTRSLLLELGSRLAGADAIGEASDIFMLEKDEIESCVARLERGETLDDLKGKVAERQAWIRRLTGLTPPAMLPPKKRVMGIKTDMFLAQNEAEQTGDLLKGTAASAGKITAPACVLRSTDDFDRMRSGDVLVAGTTTPAWTPLFAMASAVVTDIGGPLSHGSIIAREYGIPAVMGTGVATRRIQNGQLITVDGDAGTVEILTEQAG